MIDVLEESGLFRNLKIRNKFMCNFYTIWFYLPLILKSFSIYSSLGST